MRSLSQETVDYVYFIKDETTKPIYVFRLFQGKLDMVSTLQELGFSTLKTWVGSPVDDFVPVASTLVEGQTLSVQAFHVNPTTSKCAPLRVRGQAAAGACRK